MFAPVGWITLLDVYHYFVWYFSEHKSLGPYVFTGDEMYELTWAFAEEAETLSVCLPNGSVVSASRQLVFTVNECDHENEHVNLHYGTVGSGSVLLAEKFPDELTRKEYMAATYGPFQNLPIVFLNTEFDEFIAQLVADEERAEGFSDEESNSGTRDDMSPRAVSERILKVWKLDQSLTFAALKEMVAPKLSFRAFRFAWGLAVMEQPKLAKKGRRKKT